MLRRRDVPEATDTGWHCPVGWAQRWGHRLRGAPGQWWNRTAAEREKERDKERSGSGGSGSSGGGGGGPGPREAREARAETRPRAGWARLLQDPPGRRHKGLHKKGLGKGCFGLKLDRIGAMSGLGC
uniref:C-type natriuretic peptide n=1 Tax=Falco tinnunculus TaxID=100819 RepID=A0A8C4VC20_FALTI